MKKQILTLTFCLALTATSALAAVTNRTSATTPVKVTASLQKACDKPVLTSEQTARKNFDIKLMKERELFHNALNLTPDQKKKADAIDEKAKKDAEPLYKRACEERAKFKDLTIKNAPKEELIKQELAMKTARKALKKHFKASRAEFEALLTKEQLAKLKILNEQKKTEMKKMKKERSVIERHKKSVSKLNAADLTSSVNGDKKKQCPFASPCAK